MRKMVLFLFSGAIVLSMLLAGAATVSAEPKIINLTVATGHPYGPSLWVTLTRDLFEKEVNKKLAEKGEYQIKWTEGFGGTIMKIGGELDAVESGLADLTHVIALFTWSKLKLHNLTYLLPFGPDNLDMVTNSMDELHESIPGLRNELERHNQILLVGGGADNYNLFTNFTVTKLEDLKGHKFGAASANIPLIKFGGGVPVESNIVDWYNMAKTGILDGVIIHTTGGMSFKMYEVLPHLVKVNFGARYAECFTINKGTWEKLPPDVKGAIKESARLWQHAFHRQMEKDGQMTEKRVLENGGSIDEFPEAERIKWANALPPLGESPWAKAAMAEGLPVKETVNKYIDKIEAKGGRFARDWRIK